MSEASAEDISWRFGEFATDGRVQPHYDKDH